MSYSYQTGPSLGPSQSLKNLFPNFHLTPAPLVWNQHPLPLKAIYNVKFLESIHYQVSNYKYLVLSSVLNEKNLCSTNKTFEQKEVLLNKIYKSTSA